MVVVIVAKMGIGTAVIAAKMGIGTAAIAVSLTVVIAVKVKMAIVANLTAAIGAKVRGVFPRTGIAHPRRIATPSPAPQKRIQPMMMAPLI
jgi:hypothetical protein